MFRLLERNLWLALLLVATLLGVLGLTLLKLGGHLPLLAAAPPTPRTPPSWPSAERVSELFAVASLTVLVPTTNTINPFYTLQFQPPPPPPPPPTKKVELLYQGCYIGSRYGKLAYVQVADQMLILTNGAKVVADHAIKEIAVRTLTLTNAAGQTNLLQFNVKTALDVPAT